MSAAQPSDRTGDDMVGDEKKGRIPQLRPLNPLEISLVTGIILTLAFVGLEHRIFHRESPTSSQWKEKNGPEYLCDRLPNCYPHPSDKSLCGRPFNCHQKISEWDQTYCSVNQTEQSKGDFVFVLQANAKMEETIHKTATKIWENYGKKLIVLFDDDEAADLCKIHYDNLEIRCAPFKKDGKKFLCGTVHCSSENGYICELEKIISEYDAIFFMREPLEFNPVQKTGDLIEYIKSFDKPMLTMGGTFFKTPDSNNFISYFPGEIPKTTRKFEALYFERSAWEKLKWAKSFLFESVYGSFHNAQHNTLLHLIEKIKLDNDYPHVPRPDSLSGPQPVPTGIELYRAFYISLVIFFMFIAYSIAYGIAHFGDDDRNN